MHLQKIIWASENCLWVGAEAAHVGAVIECFVLIGSDSTNDGSAGKATTHAISIWNPNGYERLFSWGVLSAIVIFSSRYKRFVVFIYVPQLQVW